MARRACKPLLGVDVLAVSLHADTQRFRQIGMAIETGVLCLCESYQPAANHPRSNDDSHNDCGPAPAWRRIANLNHAASLCHPAVHGHNRSEEHTSELQSL